MSMASPRRPKGESALTEADWKHNRARLALKLYDIFHKADNEPAEVKDALAARFHVDALQVGVTILNEGGPSDARTWFNFGATCALYLGAATARLDCFIRHEPNARLAKAISEGQSKGGKTTAQRRWEKGKEERRWRNQIWIDRNDLLRQKHPDWSARKRYQEIVMFSQEEEPPRFFSFKRALGPLQDKSWIGS